MLDRVLEGLCERGVLASPDPSHYLYVFNNRASINLIIFDKNTKERLVFLKISDQRDFRRTFEVLSKVRRIVGDAIPEPVCVMAVDRWQVLATRAYRLDLLAGKPRLGFRDQCRVVDGAMQRLVELHSRTRGGSIAIDDPVCQETIAAMERRFFDQWDDQHLFDAFREHMRALAREGDLTIPEIPQHGDLVVFNTALVDGNKEKIMFIDWDSYGQTQLACLDAVTFLVTFANRYGAGLYSESRLSRHLAEVAKRYCDAIGVPRRDLHRLYPLCLLHYAELRREFGVAKGQEFAYREMKRFFDQRERFVLA